MSGLMNSPTTSASWSHFLAHYVRYAAPDISLDTSRVAFAAGFEEALAPKVAAAFTAMAELEKGAIANPDEGRMVGHYWLRNAALAPNAQLQEQVRADGAEAQAFAAEVHAGQVRAANGEKFTDVLVIGIGGSALGPQLVADALGDMADRMRMHTFDNTDPDGMDRALRRLQAHLATTLVVVISKSGGTPETRNGMLMAKAAYEAAGLVFGAHAVAVTGVGSKMDAYATAHHFIKRFPMQDWVGGRTSVMSTVGLVPMTLQGVDVTAFLAGAKEMDDHTRVADASTNMAMRLALAWYSTGGGRGRKDMVVLPYKDRLMLFSKYLQQLVMESLGKEQDLAGAVVHQGLAVYGNKGSTDQHAYVQQLRDGVNNFFATFIEVRTATASATPLEVEPGVTCGDYLQGFLRGTREALAGNGRESVTISLPYLDAYYLGALIALFERTVGFYALLVNVNAYHQPGVEAGKKAAADFLELLAAVKAALTTVPQTAEAIAASIQREPEAVYHCLNHLAANLAGVTSQRGATAAQDLFRK